MLFLVVGWVCETCKSDSRRMPSKDRDGDGEVRDASEYGGLCSIGGIPQKNHQAI